MMETLAVDLSGGLLMLIFLMGAALVYPVYLMRSRLLFQKLNYFRIAFDLAPCPMWIKDHTGLCVAVNKQFCSHFGVQDKEYLEMTLTEQQNVWLTHAQTSVEDSIDHSDLITRMSDEVVLTVRRIKAPYPERSQLVRPEESYEYFISKRRFPLGVLWRREDYGIVSSAVSMESVLQYAQRAREQQEELIEKDPVLQAIHQISEQMQTGFNKVDGRLTNVERELAAQKRELDDLVAGSDHAQTSEIEIQIAGQTAEVFDDFIKPR